MSATEIITELPRLTLSERRAVQRTLLELAAQDEEVALCHQTALEGAMMLDRMDEEGARRQRKGGMSSGRPTRMKKRAKAWERCSR